MPNSKKKNPDMLASIAGYAKNVVKEYSQWNNQPGPNHPARNAASGQFWGALLQGRRYDDKTGKQIKVAPAKALMRFNPTTFTKQTNKKSPKKK